MPLHLSTAGYPAPNTTADAAPTMSSREIAELVNSRHDKVKQSIERLAGRGVIALPPLGEYLDSLGRAATEYRIGKRDSYVIVAQLSPEFTARLVDRWQKLEQDAAAGAFAIPKSMSEALQLAADQARQIEQQQVLLIEQQPKVEFYEQFVNSDGLFGYQNAGRALGCRPGLFTRWLQPKYCFHQGGALIPRSEYVNAGLFVVKVEPGTDEVTRPRGWITPKGLDYFAKRIPQEIKVVTPSSTMPSLLLGDRETFCSRGASR